MELTGARLLPVPQLTAWAALTDMERLRQALPGCESIVPRGDSRQHGIPLAYELVVGMTIGPVTARLGGTLRLTDLAPPDRYVLHFEGATRFMGQVWGSAAFRLTPLPNGSTHVTYTADIAAVGRVAKLGPQLMARAVRVLLDRFFARFAADLSMIDGSR